MSDVLLDQPEKLESLYIFPFLFLQSNCSELGAVCMPLNQDLKLTRCVCSNGVILDHVHPKCSSCKFSEFFFSFLHNVKLLQPLLMPIFARDISLMKKLEIEKTKPTFIISVLKVEHQVVLVSLIPNILINKMSLANNLMRKKISTDSNSALSVTFF